ncbi:MAG TPA: sugar ABC transporter permease [Roseiflexaceae bacterium]|nr:sugar ABC transporter permease [Roseiflexaceae bacterium]
MQAILPRRRISMREWRERLLFILLVGPNLLLLLAFTFWPMLYNAYLSLISWNFLSPVRSFVGLANYGSVLSSQLFLTVLLNTLIFTSVSVAISLVCGLALALLLNQPLRWRNGARAVLFTPTVLAGSAIAIVWIYIFDPRFGLLQELLGWFGIASPRWLSDPAWAMAAVIIVYAWKNLGYAVVIYLAGLQAIDRTLYEAAEIDGADGLARFRHVTLPGLSPIIFFLLVTSILACFQAFDIIQVMTQGGPINATNTLVYYLYERGFVRMQAGAAGVVAMVMFGLMLLLTLLQLRFLERRVHYA